METRRLVHLVRRWGPPLLVMGLIFFASSQAKGSALMPDFGGWTDFLVKKSAHLIVYAALGLAWVNALTDSALPRAQHLALALLLTVLYAISDEFHQSFVAGREPAIRDVLIDTGGGIVGLLLFHPVMGVFHRETRLSKDNG